jgi:hypothetical protein
VVDLADYLVLGKELVHQLFPIEPQLEQGGGRVRVELEFSLFPQYVQKGKVVAQKLEVASGSGWGGSQSQTE